MAPLRVVFVVQGEGRGHMTQALALASHLREAGHEIAHVLVGRSPWRSIPSYFRDGLAAPLTEFEAPVQVPGRNGRRASALRSVLDAGRRLGGFRRAIETIEAKHREADVVVNFLDLLGGLARARSPRVPTLALAHNHVFLHPQLEHAPGPAHLRRAVLGYARVTSARADLRVALSFDPLPDVERARLRVAPPLLRPGLHDLDARCGGYLLAYVLNAGYGAELATWQARNPKVEVHCYLDGGATAFARADAAHGLDRGGGAHDRGFHVHDLDQEAFLRHLAGCRAYAGSAGFESVSEAFWLGKPVLAVPTEGQFEQRLNAWDAERCGVATAGRWVDLDDFWSGAAAPDPARVARFRAWVARAPEMLVDAVEETAHIRRA